MMNARYWAWLTVGLAAALAAACSGRGDDLEVGGPYSDGDRNGTIVSIDDYGSCYRVTVEYDPTWQCTEEQIAEAGAGSGGYYDEYGEYDAPGIGYEEPSEPYDPSANVALQVQTCDDLADLRRPALKNSYHTQLDAQRLRQLQTNCLPTQGIYYYDSHGQRTEYCTGDYADGGFGTGGTSSGVNAGDPVAGGSGGSGAEDYSTTNNQVSGVDEADYIKNTGEHIYVLSADGLRVFDAWPAPEASQIAHMRLPGEPRRLFLRGDRALVYTRVSNPSSPDPYAYGAPQTTSPSDQGCTYGYDCRFTSEGGRTLMIALDVSNPAAPTELARFELSGGFVAARRVDNHIYTVVHDGGPMGVPGLDVSLDVDSPAALEGEYAELSGSIDATIDELPSSYFLPYALPLTASGGPAGEPATCDNALAVSAAQGENFVSLVTLDIETLAEPHRTLVSTKPGFVYASADALYVATDGIEGTDQGYYYRASPEYDGTTLHKFALDGAMTSYIDSVPIRGHVLNQFSMDERDGVLRVATSNGWVPDPNVSSNITTIEEQQGSLVRLGELNGLAPTEDIRSVRFDGDRGFVVTFKKTDPLFVIDLSQPASPAVLGELKIPGFSTYMHRLDEDHLLAVGFDADDQGSFAYFDGMLVQIFDVSDLTNPLLKHKTVIGTRGSGSEALTNHLAFNYFPSNGMLAMPVTVCEGGDNGVAGDQLTFAGLIVFDISVDNGISEHGRLPFATDQQIAASDVGCGQWWTNATSSVKRSIFMDNYLFGISDTLMNVAELSELSTVLRSLPLVESP